jgi:hypothetical protein
MKFWETFLKNIFRLFAGRSLKKLRENSIETTLARSVKMLDDQTIEEIRSFIKGQQASDGGFKDRGGKCDLYYSLFGCYVAEALGIDEIRPSLKVYLKSVIEKDNLSGIYLKCAVILYIKLFETTILPSALRRNEKLAAQYSDFINLLAYYYSEDYASLFLVSQKLKKIKPDEGMPCSVLSAGLILQHINSKHKEEPWKWMKGYYKKGSFSAFSKTANGDLLSTGVALYALRFVNSDLCLIKPESLSYIDSLYSDGGFCATALDPGTDAEYTFYGLLGLGSLTD